MIKLSGSRFTDIMPENLASQAEVQAIAYAVGRQVEKLCAYSDAARTYAAIATMPEWLLESKVNSQTVVMSILVVNQ